MMTPGYDWKLTLKKAITHAGISLGSVCLAMIFSYMASQDFLDLAKHYPAILLVVPVIQGVITAARNWLSNHDQDPFG